MSAERTTRDEAPLVIAVAIRAYVEMIHSLAALLVGQGILVIAHFGQDPDGIDPNTGKRGQELPPCIPHVEIGDVETAVRMLGNLAAGTHANVYMALAAFRPDLGRGRKGYEKDIVCVLGLVADFDRRRSRTMGERLPIQPNYVIETSVGRFQAFYLFDEPEPIEAVKPIAERLKIFAGCDHDTADLSHVWRVAGRPN